MHMKWYFERKRSHSVWFHENKRTMPFTCCTEFTVSTSVNYVLWKAITCQGMFTGSKKGMTLMRSGDGSRVGTGKRMETPVLFSFTVSLTLLWKQACCLPNRKHKNTLSITIFKTQTWLFKDNFTEKRWTGESFWKLRSFFSIGFVKSLSQTHLLIQWNYLAVFFSFRWILGRKSWQWQYMRLTEALQGLLSILHSFLIHLGRICLAFTCIDFGLTRDL